MKFLSKLSLQWRVTILTAFILVVCSVSITAFSIYNAKKMLYPALVQTEGTVSVVESEPEDTAAYSALATPAEERKQQFDLSSIWFCVAVTVLGTSFVWFIAGKALEPVKTLNKKISEIDESNLSTRLPDTVVKDEIGQLTFSFNHMLERLEEAFNRQKRFTASAAHELKTPLATVKAGMQVLQRDENATLQDYQENAEVTVKCIDRLSSLVNDLLLMSSAEEQKYETSEKIYLDAIFDAVFSELTSFYEKQNISYAVECGVNIIYGNTSMLYRAFYNLIENAYKYNRINGRISVRTYEENGFSYIEISDTGIGIPKEHLPLICEAFYRVDSSRSRKIAGAGLGLSIVQTIIKKHNGTITIDSKEGIGTTCTVRLPQQ